MLNYLLVILLSVELVIAFWGCNHDILSPACVFSASFLIAVINLMNFIEYWKVDLHRETLVVICGGVLVFEIVALIIHGLFRQKKRYQRKFAGTLKAITIEKWKLNFMIGFNIMILLMVEVSIIQIVKRYGAYENIFNTIGIYRQLSMRRNDISFSSIVNYLHLFSKVSGQMWLYILINNYLVTHRISYRIVINFMLSIVAFMVGGGRGGILFLILSGVPVFYFLWCKKNRRIAGLKLEYIIKIILLLVILAVCYRSLGVFIGRDIKSAWYEHLSINLSAPVLNLDAYLQQKWNEPAIWGYNTFGYLIKALGRNLHIESWVYDLSMPFRFVNGHALGNVYTIFCSFYGDFRYKGVFGLTAVMACIMQVFYEKCRGRIYRIKGIEISIIIYAYLLVLLGFSFFYNRFYAEIITISFLKKIVTLWALKIFLTKVKFIGR